MLENIFLSVLNMSLTATVIAILIMSVRLIVKNKMPKIFSYALWSIILVRLLVPVYFGAVFSIFNLLPASYTTPITDSSQNIGIMRYIPGDSIFHNNDAGEQQAHYNSTTQTFQGSDKASGGNEIIPSSERKEIKDSKQVIVFFAAIIWLLGAAVFLAISVIMYRTTVKRLKTAVIYIDDGIVHKISRKLKLRRKIRLFSSDVINTPIVCGLIKPRIILPLPLVQGGDISALAHIVTHEFIHIKRLDYLIKPLSVLAVCVHWFNPVVWLSFFLSQKDMEMSCDEKVIDVSDTDIRSDYASSLINLSVRQNSYLNGGLLAFGESSIKSRIKGIMSYKKRSFWVAAIATLVLVTLGAVLLTNPHRENTSIESVKNKDSNKVETDVVKSGGGLEFYLVRGNNQKYTGENVDLSSLELENEPLLSKADIVSYNWDLHGIKIKNTGKISNELLQSRFVVVVDGEKIYQGAFWSAIYSMIPPRIAVYLDSLDLKSEYLILSLGSWNIGGEIQPNVKAALDEFKAKEALEREGKLFKPYNPKNFPLPDSISVFEYTDLDWEKQDDLIRILDARFVNKLDYANYKFIPEEDNEMREKETVIRLNYKENISFKFNIGGKDTEIIFSELMMPVTGSYDDLLYFRSFDNYPEFDGEYKHGYIGYSSAPVGKLEKFENIDMLSDYYPKEIHEEVKKPEGIHLIYDNERKKPCYYEFSKEETKSIEDAEKNGKLLKELKGNNPPRFLNIRLEYDSKGKKWYRICDDRKTLLYNGKYYNNPTLVELILDIAKEKCGFEVFDTSRFKDIVEAKYSFKTKTRTFESVIDDKLILRQIGKGLMEAKQSQGGGCPLDGILTLTFGDGRTMDIIMASDDCAWMFVEGNCLDYSQELHEIFVENFDNFPYVRSR